MTPLELNDLNAKVEQSGNLSRSTFYNSKPGEHTPFTQKVEVEQGRGTPKINRKSSSMTTTPHGEWATNEQDILSAYRSQLQALHKNPINRNAFLNALSHLKRYLAGRSVLTFREEEQEPYKQFLREQEQFPGRTLRPFTQMILLSRCKKFYRWLKAQGHIRHNPLETYHPKAHLWKLQATPTLPIQTRKRRYQNAEIYKTYSRFLLKRASAPDYAKRQLYFLREWVRFLSERRLSFVRAGVQDLQAYQERLETEIRETGRPYSLPFQKTNLYSIRKFYGWLLSQGHLEKSPFETFGIHETYQNKPPEPARVGKPYRYQQAPKGFEVLFERLQTYENAKGMSLHARKDHLKGYFQFLDYLSVRNNIQDIRQINVDLMLQYPAHVAALRTPRGKPIGATTRARHIWNANHLLFTLFKWKVLEEDFSEILPNPKVTTSLSRAYMTSREMNLFLSFPDLKTEPGFRDRTLMELLYSSGMRIGEALRLRVQDVMWKEGLVRVEYPKGGQSFQRVVPVGQVALQYMDHYRRHIRAKYALKNEETFFVSRKGKGHQAIGSITKRIQGYREKLGIRKPITAHSFRVSCATDMLRNKANLRHVQEQLGHKEISSTQIYTRVFPVDLKKAHQKSHPRERKCFDVTLPL